ncbi:hypothetical protein [Bacillus sp. NPDC093026]|uniref:hypothetical protein n=1 Tax=Bacillus sp. NPDC093026 TaxID=3363948 RepID=UPI003820C9EB
MKMNDKRREIQKKYREEIRKQRQWDNNYKNYTKETIIVIAIIVLIIFLNLTFHEL